jgi:hypothetical protein
MANLGDKSITTPIIHQIEELVKDIPGWTPIDQLYTLFNLVYLTADLEGDIVEIGSWCGRSAVVLGTAAKLIGNTKIFCIDLFPEKNDWKQNDDGSYSFEAKISSKTYGAYQVQTVWKEPFERDIAPIYKKYNSVLDVFTENIAKNNLPDLVKPYKGNSTLFIGQIDENFKCKLAFLDGDHSYEAVCQDIINLDKYLIEGGWLCFDDAFSSYDGVNGAIESLVINNPAYELCQQMTRKFFIARKKKCGSNL